MFLSVLWEKHLGCWENTWKVWESLAYGSWFSNISRVSGIKIREFCMTFATQAFVASFSCHLLITSQVFIISFSNFYTLPPQSSFILKNVSLVKLLNIDNYANVVSHYEKCQWSCICYCNIVYVFDRYLLQTKIKYVNVQWFRPSTSLYWNTAIQM
jgi:hypothetical protein